MPFKNVIAIIFLLIKQLNLIGAPYEQEPKKCLVRRE